MATSMRFEIHTWTRYSDADNGWTEQNAENMVDALEQQIAQALHTVRGNTANWIRLEYDAPSIIETVAGQIVGGVPYIHEAATVRVTVRDPLVSRQTIRDAIAAVLTQFVTNAAAVYAYQRYDLTTWPAVTVTGAGSDRRIITG